MKLMHKNLTAAILQDLRRNAYDLAHEMNQLEILDLLDCRLNHDGISHRFSFMFAHEKDANVTLYAGSKPEDANLLGVSSWSLLYVQKSRQIIEDDPGSDCLEIFYFQVAICPAICDDNEYLVRAKTFTCLILALMPT